MEVFTAREQYNLIREHILFDKDDDEWNHAQYEAFFTSFADDSDIQEIFLNEFPGVAAISANCVSASTFPETSMNQ